MSFAREAAKKYEQVADKRTPEEKQAELDRVRHVATVERNAHLAHLAKAEVLLSDREGWTPSMAESSRAAVHVQLAALYLDRWRNGAPLTPAQMSAGTPAATVAEHEKHTAQEHTE